MSEPSHLVRVQGAGGCLVMLILLMAVFGAGVLAGLAWR